MAVPVEREPRDFGGGAEPCAMCGRATAFWTALVSRSAGGQVACCRPCAELAGERDIPSKAAWFARHTQGAIST